LKSSLRCFWISGISLIISIAEVAGSRTPVLELRTIPIVPPAKRRHIFGFMARKYHNLEIFNNYLMFVC